MVLPILIVDLYNKSVCEVQYFHKLNTQFIKKHQLLNSVLPHALKISV